jgi:hypothetical protein
MDARPYQEGLRFSTKAAMPVGGEGVGRVFG